MCELLFYQNKGMDSFLFDTKKRPTQVTVCFIITGCSVIQRTYSKIILYSFYNLDFNYKANHGCLHTQPQKKKYIFKYIYEEIWFSEYETNLTTLSLLFYLIVLLNTSRQPARLTYRKHLKHRKCISQNRQQSRRHFLLSI